jgi:pilus assembly protein CpaC
LWQTRWLGKFQGRQTSGGEADVNNRDKHRGGNAGLRRPKRATVNGVPALGRCAAAAIAATLMVGLARAPARAQSPQPAGSNSSVGVRVAVGQSKDVSTDRSFTDIIVSDPSVAAVRPLTNQSFAILAQKKIGTTRITAFDKDRQPVQSFDVRVVPVKISDVENVYDLSGLARAISGVGGGGIRVSEINSHILLSGSAPDAVTLDRVVNIARQFDPHLIDAVTVSQQQQVELDVRFIEVDRSASREIGVQWNYFGNSALTNIGSMQPAEELPITQPNGTFQQAAAAGTGIGGRSVQPSNIQGLPLSPVVAAGVLSGAAPFGFLVGQLSNRLQIEVNALEQRGLARMLAEPNLVSLSGQTASFNVGGQIPVQTASATGTPSFSYMRYGVGLAFTPTVLQRGVINLVIKPDVSQLDWANAVNGQPALTDRSASTTLELRNGQSFMLGGLLQNSTSPSQQELPWLGQIPVLGALFRSSSYLKHETDLVILVTPHLVRPLPPTVQLHTPLDHNLPANDPDFFLMGKAEVNPRLAWRAAGAVDRPYVGEILDLPEDGGAYVSAKD